MLGRSFQVSGRHEYDRGGRLVSFGFDPLTVTDGIVSVVSGNYMSLDQVGRAGLGIGVVGYLATRERFRGRGGHGTALVRAFEQRAAALASSRGERLRLIVLEAAPGSTGFWTKRGYRWPEGTHYFQPPLDFDPVTGAPRHREVPELLMVKLWDQPEAQAIETALLKDVVQTVFRNWYSDRPASFTPQAAEKATAYVWQHVFPRFTASLRPAGLTGLREPPSA
jgi:GNAT superfamily N-acetyltransferase